MKVLNCPEIHNTCYRFRSQLNPLQAGPGRTVQQEQEEISRNHAQAFSGCSVHVDYSYVWLLHYSQGGPNLSLPLIQRRKSLPKRRGARPTNIGGAVAPSNRARARQCVAELLSEGRSFGRSVSVGPSVVEMLQNFTVKRTEN